MSDSHKPDLSWADFIRLARVARGLQAGGFYNIAKLFWAASFSETIQSSQVADLTALPDEVEAAITVLEEAGISPELKAVLRSGQQAFQENRTIRYDEVPAVHVCRECGNVILGERPDACPACGAHGLTLHLVEPIYFLEFLSPEQVLSALESGPDDLQALIEGFDDEQLAQAPAPGEWSVRETLWHILVAQGLLENRVERLIDEDHPDLKSVAAWVIDDAEPPGARAILERYRESRMRVLDKLRNMPDSGWWRTGFHEEWGIVTLLEQATYFARHERSHWLQIKEALTAAGA